jgi:pimeloyl-ACP methyl ester carboxylesterase
VIIEIFLGQTTLCGHTAHMPPLKPAIAAFCILLASSTLSAQQSRAIASDPASDPKAPTQNIETVIPSNGARLMGIFLLAAGAQPHGTVILLHGFPGYEQNMDLAQALRRDGWNVLAMHYRGAWGSDGSFSFTHCIEDVGAMLAYVTEPGNAARFHVNTKHIVTIGHSMGGFVSLVAMAQHPEIAAGVVLTEGSPVLDAAGFFGNQSDPADYAPLAGTSRDALENESKANAAAWSFPSLAAQVTPRPALVLSANDGLRASNEALVSALTRAGSPVAYVHMDTDHGFSDHRIALQTAVLQWLDKTIR